MDDQQIHQRIDDLVAEEHHLERTHSGGTGLSDAERARLDDLGVQLDRYWDLLRQRDARRRVGQDPDAAELRDGGTVESYRQ